MGGGVSGLITAPFNEPHHLTAVQEILQKTFEWDDVSRRIKVITASNYVLKALTLGMMRAGTRPREFGIAFLTSKGGQLTDRWKRIFRRVWRADILDVYGLSEVPGFHCTTCPRCGSFRPSRTAIIEFIGLDRGIPTGDGLARIVTTALYPLAELIPVIRYDTGDIAFREPGRPTGCEDCFVLLGRNSDVIRLPGSSGDPCVLSRLLVANVLDSLPLVARSPEEPMASRVGIRSDFGHPIFNLLMAAGKGMPVITVAAKLRDGHRPGDLGQSPDLSSRLKSAIFPPEDRDTFSVGVRYAQ